MSKFYVENLNFLSDGKWCGFLFCVSETVPVFEYVSMHQVELVRDKIQVHAWTRVELFLAINNRLLEVKLFDGLHLGNQHTNNNQIQQQFWFYDHILKYHVKTRLVIFARQGKIHFFANGFKSPIFSMKTVALLKISLQAAAIVFKQLQVFAISREKIIPIQCTDRRRKFFRNFIPWNSYHE